MSKTKVILGCLVMMMALVGCSETKTNDPKNDNTAITEIAQTVQAAMTLSVASNPTATPAATQTPAPTLLPSPLPAVPATNIATAAPITNTSSTVSSCDLAGFISDITIPDGTILSSGSTFTKTWRLRNDGTCSWTSSYLLVFYSGNSMDGPATQQLTTTTIIPGQTIDVSVSLTAPTDYGTYNGYWLLRNASGVNFGISKGGSPFYVQVVVGTTLTPTITSTSTTPTATPTATTVATTEPTATTAPTTASTATTAPTSTFVPTSTTTTGG